MGVAAKPFGTHQHAAAPHKGRAGADREGDEQRKVVDQCAVCGQAGASGGQVKGVACSRGGREVVDQCAVCGQAGTSGKGLACNRGEVWQTSAQFVGRPRKKLARAAGGSKRSLTGGHEE